MKAIRVLPLFRGLLAMAAALTSLASLSLNGAAYIKFDGVPGESRDKDHVGEIDVQAWDWGMTYTLGTVGGGGAGKASFDRIRVTKRLDKATPLLMQRCASGQIIPSATLVVRNDATRTAYLKITLTDVVVTSVATGGSADEQSHTESIVIDFAKVAFEYVEQGDDGSVGEPVRFNWDIAANQEG